LYFPREGGRFDFENLEIATSGDLACAYGLLKCGKPGDSFPVRLTVILRNVDGAWTIVHEHHSVPAAVED
jgi:ketosteroid isomerase-like protein